MRGPDRAGEELFHTLRHIEITARRAWHDLQPIAKAARELEKQITREGEEAILHQRRNGAEKTSIKHGWFRRDAAFTARQNDLPDVVIRVGNRQCPAHAI